MKNRLNTSLLSRLAAFTLAEVLITLGIIGVVAAMTMPSLIQNTKEKEVISKLKKFQSLMSQAFLMSVNENGTPDNWGLDANFNIQTPVLSDKFIPYLKITKDCGLIGKCFYNKDIYFLNNLKWTNLYNPTGWGQMTLELADGSLVAMNVISSDCSSVRGTSKNLQNVCAFLYIDVNGGVKPNIFGKDFLVFMLQSMELFQPVYLRNLIQIILSLKIVLEKMQMEWGVLHG